MSFRVLNICFEILGLGVDGHIVHVNREPSLCDFDRENRVHHCLEGGWRVCESEEHYGWFE
jgi:hypothetical protein